MSKKGLSLSIMSLHYSESKDENRPLMSKRHSDGASSPMESFRFQASSNPLSFTFSLFCGALVTFTVLTLFCRFDPILTYSDIKVLSSTMNISKSLDVSVQKCFHMFYTSGANATFGRPQSVRAASSTQWISDRISYSDQSHLLNGRLAVLQDDANFVALVDIKFDPSTESLELGKIFSLALPSNKGIRLFSEDRNNKKKKLDFESSVFIPPSDDPKLPKHSFLTSGAMIALGSGSSPMRDVIFVFSKTILSASNDIGNICHTINDTFWEAYVGDATKNIHHDPDAQNGCLAFYLPGMYDAFRSNSNFSGAELNIEGAVHIPGPMYGKIRLFQRANGSPKQVVQAVNAVGDILVFDFLTYLDQVALSFGKGPFFFHARKHAAPPKLVHINTFSTQNVQGFKSHQVPMAFTGASAVFETTQDSYQSLFLLGAEDSPSAVEDGKVVGTGIGIMQVTDENPAPVYGLMKMPSGNLFLHKTEGVAFLSKCDPPINKPNRKCIYALTVIDMDDIAVPSEICLVKILTV